MRLRTVILLACALATAFAVSQPAPAASADCAKETKRVTTFKRGMKAAKRKYFRTHHSAKARRKFVRKQRTKLVRLQRARRRCLNRPSPSPQPSPQPTPQPPVTPGPPPPRFVAEDVASAAAIASPAEITSDGEAEVIRTQLELDLKSSATAAAVEALLRRLDATVVSSLKGVGQLTVRIPDPGSLAALDALIASLAGDPALDRADRAVVPVTEDLPEFILPGASNEVRPQLAVRAHALWNARAALTAASRPSLVVGDYFGAGPPGAEVAVTASAADFATGNPHDHGYLVLGLLAGTFDPVGLPDAQADHVTGLWAGPPLRLHAVDLRIAIGGSTFQDRLVNLIRSVPGNVVLSTSIGDGCAQTTGCGFVEAFDSGTRWVEKVRAFGLEGRVVHATAGGNVRTHLPDHTDARLNSGFNAAAVLAMTGGHLRNTLIVENAIASPTDVARPMCLNNRSKRLGHISAVGTDVTSLDGPGSGQFLAGGGTSSATPQVAATAAAVWALNPSLSPTEVIARLQATARPATGNAGDVRCASVLHAPALDAYGAVLAADDPTDAPARDAVLDAVDANGDEVVPTNGRFDEKDLVAFANAFDAAQGEIDYGRYDLNGDGRTGGGSVDRIDLDASSPPAWDFSERRSILGIEVGHDETAVTDLDVLCHEAAGPLYQGDEELRDQFLEEQCLPPVTLDVQFPAQVDPGVTHPLRVTARRADLTAPDDVLPGVHLDLTLVSGGTIGDFVGTTDEDGVFATTGRLGQGQPFLQFEIVARAGDGGAELARRTVIAQLATHGSPRFISAVHGIRVGARALSEGGEENDDDSVEVTSPSFDLSGTSSAASGPAFARAEVHGKTVVAFGDDFLSLDGDAEVEAEADADGNSFSRAGAAAGIEGYIEFEVIGGSMRFTIGRTFGACEALVSTWEQFHVSVPSPLPAGHYAFQYWCGGQAGTEDEPVAMSGSSSVRFRLFR